MSPKRRTMPLSIDELQELLMDPSTPDSALRPYLELDPDQSGPFEPSVRVKTEMVAEGAAESALALASLNGISRWRRQQAYRRRRRSWDGPIAVSEGDSWFQFPFLLDDVIDQLAGDYAILSLGAAGDLLSDMVKQDELADAIREERPHVVFLSGGGNDLLGSGRLASVLTNYRRGASAADHINAQFQPLLEATIAAYGEVFETALSAGAPRIVCHCYDYAIPAGGRWLGRPMESKGIVEPGLQRAIIVELIDRFHAALKALRRRRDFRDAVVLADTRGTVPAGAWWDELHPTDAGFAAATKVIRRAAQREPDMTESVPGARMRGGGLRGGDVFAEYSDAQLHAEIGRRIQLMHGGAVDEAAIELEGVLVTTEEGLFQPLFLIGRRVVQRLSRELYDIVCGSDPQDAADRERLKEALRLDSASIVAALTAMLVGIGVSGVVAPLVAALIYRAGIEPTIGELCAIWKDNLEPA